MDHDPRKKSSDDDGDDDDDDDDVLPIDHFPAILPVVTKQASVQDYKNKNASRQKCISMGKKQTSTKSCSRQTASYRNDSINITGEHIKQDPRYRQKPIYLAIFTNNILSYLLYPPRNSRNELLYTIPYDLHPTHLWYEYARKNTHKKQRGFRKKKKEKTKKEQNEETSKK